MSQNQSKKPAISVAERKQNQKKLKMELMNDDKKGHWNPHNQVGSLRQAKHLVEFELGTFQFFIIALSKPTKPSHSPNFQSSLKT